MKNMKKYLSLFTLALVCLSMLLASCASNDGATADEQQTQNSSQSSQEGSQNSGDATYQVSIKDVLGNSCSSGIIVRFMQNGEQAAMKACDENGNASATLPKGEYSVELSFTDGAEGYYYEAPAALTAENNTAEVILSNRITSDPSSLFVGSSEYDSYNVSAGCTYVELTSGDMNYFLFTPTTAGNYEFSVYNNPDAQIGYYGAPHYVQSMSAVEVKDNSFTISVSAGMIGSGDSGTSVYVIGINAVNGAENCIICIDRIGDPVKTIEDEPWQIYETTVELSQYQLPEGAELKEFDLTASTDTYNIVYNETDGFYHLNTADGPLVLVRLAEDSEYIASFQTILDRSGVSRYFYNEDGEFEKKVSYSECLLEYIEYVDEDEGVYPLTEDLKHIIQQRGEYVGWWDSTSSSYLFKDANGNNDLSINPDIAWLLMSCYIG